ncbi:MAG: malL, partial [Nocardioidaceae bacterium]|nr:malL [Nocardioidaceae bacterium]
LVDLGVDALWLNPFYPSPQHDHGYDVSDYRDVEPAYGTLADFDALLAAAHERGLKLLVDLVPNHTSSEHPWFRAALAAEPGSPERERYLFRPGKGDGSEPPNNWLSLFGGPAWTRVPDGSWYLHLFDTTQPDLNWRDPDVPADFEKTLRFWLDRGADGFRVDVAHALYKKEGLPDAADPQACIENRWSDDAPMWEQPESHDVFRQWHRILAEYDGDRMIVGEAWCPTPEGTAKFVRPGEMQQTFTFHWLLADWSASSFRTAITASLATLGAVGADATWVLSNHDVVRHATRYGGGATGRSRARSATLAMLALPGSSYLYQGEELGLEQVDVPEADRQDPEFIHGRGVGRDGCRVPIPWSGEKPPYGFSDADGQPWLPQPDDWADVTVAAERDDPSSTLSFYRSVLAARHTLVGAGWHRDVVWLDAGDDVLAFQRGDVTVVVNCGSTPVDLPAGTVLVATEPLDGTLPPDTAAWLR